MRVNVVTTELLTGLASFLSAKDLGIFKVSHTYSTTRDNIGLGLLLGGARIPYAS